MKKFNLTFVFLFFVLLSAASGSGDSPSPIRTESVSAPSRPCLRFKIGFEFQEINGLCPWALENINFQKRPIFGVPEQTGNFLWHVVIDSSDIEFVSRPFRDDERDALQFCLQSINDAFSFLREILIRKGTTSFDEWATFLAERQNIAVAAKNYKIVYDKPIQKPQNWHPRFAPQVTLQHPLEWTVPLYYGLFDAESQTAFHFSACFPYAQNLVDACTRMNASEKRRILEESTKKVSGLAFLHALTLVRMTPPTDDASFESEIDEAIQYFDSSNQFDVKLKLTLMSRRPFSAMLQDVAGYLSVPYEDFFKESILTSNPLFSGFFEVSQLFHLTNYGEQFFDTTTGCIIPLERLLSFIDCQPFLQERVSSLLRKGVLTTAMLRKMKNGEAVLRKYYGEGLTLSDQIGAGRKRYDVNVTSSDGEIIVENDLAYDAFSPPWFLLPSDSMGRLRESIPDEEKGIFGEAIVEVRSIKFVGDWFLRQVGLPPDLSGKFLVNPDSFTTESLQLFDFLSSFTIDKLCDINEGIVSDLTRRIKPGRR